MIEISHKNARRLLNRALHAQLEDSDWTLLQAHLESCADCRTYGLRLRRVENGLRRAMRGGWDPISGPPAGTPSTVIAALQQRQTLRLRLRIAAVSLAGLAIFFALGGPDWLRSIGSREPQSASVAVPDTGSDLAATPTGGPPDYQDFRGVLAYEGPADDQNAEIYLLNPSPQPGGTKPVNLTNHPAADSDPAWSPDGDWIAFLSDRPTQPGQPGKAEVYVTSVTGSRVVQLTAEPGITWRGPISWSHDGKWLALTGRRPALDGDSWVYLVGLDGSGVRAVAGTRGGWSPKFSRTNDRLAFAYSDGERSGVQVYHLLTQQRVSASWPDWSAGNAPIPGAELDWSPDGSGLAYIGVSNSTGLETGGDPMAEVVAVSDLNASLSLFYDFQHNLSMAEGLPGAFRAVSWSPTGAVVYLERPESGPPNTSSPFTGADPFSSPATGEECWQVRARIPSRGGRWRSFDGGGLCVDGAFNGGSWTPDGLWVVVRGRAPGEKQPGLYALRIPGRGVDAQDARLAPTATPQPGTLVRLTGPGENLGMPRVRPRLRAGDPPLSIDPRPVVDRASLPPSDFSARLGGPRGAVVYVSQQADQSLIVQVDPQGHGGRVLYISEDLNRCPRMSPDGQSLAFINVARQGGGSDVIAPASSGSYGVEEIYLLENARGLPRVLTGGNLLPENGPEPVTVRYGCPVWSPEGAPGGPYLAAVVSTGVNNFLAVLPVQGGRARFVRIGTPVTGSGPLWAHDGRGVFISQYNSLSGGPRVVIATLPDDPAMPLTTRTIPPNIEWDQIDGILPATGSNHVYLLTHRDGRSDQATVRLSTSEVGRIPDGRDTGQVIGESYRRGLRSASMVGWMYDGSILLALRRGPTEAHKAVLMRYDLSRYSLTTIGRVDDTLYATQLSPDGRWLLYSTEGGLWGLDLMGAIAGRVGPAFISPVPIEGMDWK